MTPVPARTATRIGIAIAGLALCAAIAGAIERKPLPSFALTALDGSAVGSADLPRNGEWLLIYVRPACAPCDTLLRAIDQAEAPIVAPRTVVVIGGVDAAAAVRLAGGFTSLNGAAWYADANSAMAHALPLAGAPVVFGMRGSMVEWSLAGVVPDAASMRTALVSWAGRQH
jgi:hypothetical protein